MARPVAMPHWPILTAVAMSLSFQYASFIRWCASWRFEISHLLGATSRYAFSTMPARPSPVDVIGVEVNAQPAAIADVRGAEEVLRVLAYKQLLRAHGRCKPHTQPVVVVMIGGGGELLATDEPGGLAMTLFLSHSR